MSHGLQATGYGLMAVAAVPLTTDDSRL